MEMNILNKLRCWRESLKAADAEVTNETTEEE